MLEAQKQGRIKKMYLSITKYIYPNYNTYLSKFKNVFVFAKRGNIVGSRRNLARSQFRGQTLGGGNTCCVNTRDPVASAEIQIGKYKQTNTKVHKYPNTRII